MKYYLFYVFLLFLEFFLTNMFTFFISFVIFLNYSLNTWKECQCFPNYFDENFNSSKWAPFWSEEVRNMSLKGNFRLYFRSIVLLFSLYVWCACFLHCLYNSKSDFKIYRRLFSELPCLRKDCWKYSSKRILINGEF